MPVGGCVQNRPQDGTYSIYFFAPEAVQINLPMAANGSHAATLPPFTQLYEKYKTFT